MSKAYESPFPEACEASFQAIHEALSEHCEASLLAAYKVSFFHKLVKLSLQKLVRLSRNLSRFFSKSTRSCL